MRLIFLFIIVIFLYATPNWYLNLTPSNPNIYIGYGVASNQDVAKKEALQDIASQINTKINTIIIHNQSRISKHYDNNIKINSIQKIGASISDYKILKIDYENGKYFIAIEYENIPNIEKFIRKLPKKLKTSQNKFLNATFLGKYIKQKVGKFIDFHIYFKDNNWFISYENISQILDKNMFNKLFINYLNKIKTNHKYNIFKTDDIIKLFIKSDYKGYVTIFDVDSEGNVYTLLSQKVKKGWNEIKSNDFDLIAYTDKKIDFEIYIAVYSKSFKNYNEFNSVFNQKENKDFGNLIDFLKDKDFASLKIITKGE